MESNEQWVSGVRDSFEVELGLGHYEECDNLIKRVCEEGYEEFAKELQIELSEEKVFNFIVK